LSFKQQSEQTIEQAYDLLKNRMKNAHERFEPEAKFPQLVAVSKTLPVEKITPLLDLGHRIFGENRVQEATGKWPELLEKYPGVELHLIGPLQTNKVREALKIFDVVQSLDREKLARALSLEVAKTGKQIKCFVQVNLAGEEQKSGIAPGNLLDFIKTCRKKYTLDIVGLMCIPPQGEAAGPYFAQLKILGKEAGVNNLSMGMSADYEAAIEMGATHIRVGTALFGKR